MEMPLLERSSDHPSHHVVVLYHAEVRSARSCHAGTPQQTQSRHVSPTISPHCLASPSRSYPIFLSRLFSSRFHRSIDTRTRHETIARSARTYSTFLPTQRHFSSILYSYRWNSCVWIVWDISLSGGVAPFSGRVANLRQLGRRQGEFLGQFLPGPSI